MITEDFYTTELDAAKHEARQWQEAHDKKAQELINLQGKMREVRITLLTAFKFINEQIDK
jgi:hypothetical protein